MRLRLIGFFFLSLSLSPKGTTYRKVHQTPSRRIRQQTASANLRVRRTVKPWFLRTVYYFYFFFRPENAESAMSHIFQQGANAVEQRRGRTLSKTDRGRQNPTPVVRPAAVDKPTRFFVTRHSFRYGRHRCPKGFFVFRDAGDECADDVIDLRVSRASTPWKRRRVVWYFPGETVGVVVFLVRDSIVFDVADRLRHYHRLFLDVSAKIHDFPTKRTSHGVFSRLFHARPWLSGGRTHGL